MSEDSVDSTIDEQEDRNVNSSGISKRLKTLLCCFKREQEEMHEEEMIEYDPEEYDYVVEKLIVKRVPLALFAADFPDRCRHDVSAIPNDISQSTCLSIFDGNDPAMNAITRNICLTSMKTAMDSTTYNPAANKILHLDGNKSQNLIRKKFSGLNPDLKKSQRLSKDSLNFSLSKQSFVENISKVESSTRTNVSSKSTSSLATQNNLSTRGESARRISDNSLFGFWNRRNTKTQTEKDFLKQLRNVSSGKNQDNFIPGWNRKYIVSPFRVQRGSFDLTKPKSVDGNFVNGKSLKYIKEPLEDKSSELAENSKDHDSRSNTAVRWRITVRHQRLNANAERVAPDV